VSCACSSERARGRGLARLGMEAGAGSAPAAPPGAKESLGEHRAALLSRSAERRAASGGQRRRGSTRRRRDALPACSLSVSPVLYAVVPQSGPWPGLGVERKRTRAAADEDGEWASMVGQASSGRWRVRRKRREAPGYSQCTCRSARRSGSGGQGRRRRGGSARSSFASSHHTASACTAAEHRQATDQRLEPPTQAAGALARRRHALSSSSSPTSRPSVSRGQLPLRQHRFARRLARQHFGRPRPARRLERPLLPRLVRPAAPPPRRQCERPRQAPDRAQRLHPPRHGRRLL